MLYFYAYDSRSPFAPVRRRPLSGSARRVQPANKSDAQIVSIGFEDGEWSNKTHYHIVTEALFSVDDDVSTSSLCQVERRKSKTLEYSNKVLQGPAA